MCGICGIKNFDGSLIQPEQLQLMMQMMKRRGPDDQGFMIDENVGLGFVRLSILDLTEAGHQPMVTKDKRYIITFNGEIYNYIELRSQLISKGYFFTSFTDTEVLLYSYIEWGEDCLEKLNGMFAFVIYDKLTKQLFGARDRFGIKPFYYVLTDELFIYASDIPPLLATVKIKVEANEAIIFDYLVYNRSNHNSDTFFKGIVKLPPGNSFTCNNKGSFLKKKWYNLETRVAQTNSIKFNFRESFLQAVKLQLRSDVPIGSCLSGGLDSSAITAAVLLNNPTTELHTFSAVYGQGKKGDESEFINLFKDERLKMHFSYPTAQSLVNDLGNFMEALSEPVSNSSEYAEFKVMELAKQNCTVILNGQGADEIMAGYHYFYGYYFKDLLQQKRFGKLLSECSNYLQIHRSLFGIKTLLFALTPRFFNNFDYDGLSKEFLECFKYKKNNIVTTFYKSATLQNFLIKHFEFKFEHHLLWADKSGMYFSLETRFPFLDHNLVEHTLAKNVTIENGYTKVLMRNELKGILPEKIRMRVDKIGFLTPEDEWFKTPEMQLILTDILHSTTFKNRGYFSPNYCIAYYEKFLTGKGSSAKLWKWLNLELWFRKYIDQ